MKNLITLIILICSLAAPASAQVAVPFDVPSPTWGMLITLKNGDVTPIHEKANASSHILQSQCGEDCSYQWGSDSYTPEFWERVILNDSYILPFISQGYGWVQFEFNPEIHGWAQSHNFKVVKDYKLTKADIAYASDILAWEHGSDLYVIIEGGGGPGYSFFWLGKLEDGYIVCPYRCYLDLDGVSNHPGILNGVVGAPGISKFTRRDVDYILSHAGEDDEGCYVAFGYIGSDGKKEIGNLLTGMVSTQNKAAVQEDKSVYTQVETEPSFPGGMGALMSHIAKNQKYPFIAQENGEQGKVIVSLVIEKDGSVGEVGVRQSVSPALDKEAIRVVKSLPKFSSPGKINGLAVRTKMSLPVSFKLN